jgi:hypothetical protein
MLIIVSNINLLKKLREINGFKLNLGKALKPQDNEEINYSDEFIYNYKVNFKRILNIFGELGRIKLYEDVLLKSNEFVIFKNNVVYEFTFSNEEIINVRKYLSNILEKIDKTEIEANEQIKMEKQQKSNRWSSNNGKNLGKTYEVNQSLSKDDYLQELLKKKKAVN